MTVQSAYRQEEERLIETYGEIERQRGGIGPRYFGDDFVEQVLDAKREESRERLSLLAKEPYFGRLEFQETNGDQLQTLYIGKRGMDRSDWKEPYIIDWRAPVASLFYSFTGGDDPVEYEAPEGVVEGEIHRKRNIAIRDRKLERVVDSYVRGEDNLAVNDEFLLYRLGENKDNRLRDIVSTIQAEQDRIIRAPRNLSLIIQGAAGSGKTTVALHRLAYLLYQYQGHIRAERMIIFAPNSMFLDYISGVLPELGVGSIQQTTFADWSLELLGGRVKLEEEKNSLEQWFSLRNAKAREDAEPSGRLKGSLNHLAWIESCLKKYESSFLPDMDFVPWEGARLTASVMKEWFEVEYRHYPLAARRHRLVARMKRWLEMELGSLQSTHLREMVTKSSKQKLNTFMKKIPSPDTVTFYKSLYGVPRQPEWMKGMAQAALPHDMVEGTKRHLKKGFVSAEDLAPLLWIRLHFEGTEGYEFDHIVVDEAQDISPFQMAILKAHMKEPSFTILGDLAQGIHDYKGVLDWQELAEVFEAGQLSFHQLVQSYRSTTEIIEFANRIAAHAETGLPPSQPVFRSGEPVEVTGLKDSGRLGIVIAEYLERFSQGGMNTIAVIARTAKACSFLHQLLAERGIEASLIEEGQRQYRGGVSVVPAYLAKGLEFDGVLVADADAQTYIRTPQDAKLLYVACTRALHRLALIHCEEPTELIGNKI
jgi:DNA helicase II / ATP-dependent DNA helicase PcrA